MSQQKFSNKRIVHEDEEEEEDVITDDSEELQESGNVIRVYGPRVALKILASNNLAGALIGKGGSAMQSLQAQTGARIQVAHVNEHFPGTRDRVVLLTGAESAVMSASAKIVERTAEVEPITRGDGLIVVKVLIPAGASGLIIGRAGVNIRTLGEESGAKVRLNPKEDASSSQERVMIITGSVEDISKCIGLVIAKLLEDVTVGSYHNMTPSYSRLTSPYSLHNPLGISGVGNKHLTAPPTTSSEPLAATTTIQMAVPDEAIGNILGKRGSVMAEIQSLSGAKVTISPRGEFLPNSTNRSITITGSTTAAQMAQFFINNKLQSIQSRGQNNA